MTCWDKSESSEKHDYKPCKLHSQFYTEYFSMTQCDNCGKLNSNGKTRLWAFLSMFY